MRNGSQNNAMAEISLALAMGFFSIMVLTMVSMGAGFGEAKAPLKVNAAGFSVRAPASTTRKNSQASLTKIVSTDSIIIYYRDRFLNADLREIRPEEISGDGQKVLVLDPNLPMTEAIAIRNRLPVKNLIVTTLDERWLKALKEMPK